MKNPEVGKQLQTSFHEVFSYLLSPKRIGENENMSLYFFFTKVFKFTFHL